MLCTDGSQLTGIANPSIVSRSGGTTREPEFCPDSYDRHLTEYSQRERNYKKDCIEAQTRATELFEELVMKYGQELV